MQHADCRPSVARSNDKTDFKTDRSSLSFSRKSIEFSGLTAIEKMEFDRACIAKRENYLYYLLLDRFINYLYDPLQFKIFHAYYRRSKKKKKSN